MTPPASQRHGRAGGQDAIPVDLAGTRVGGKGIQGSSVGPVCVAYTESADAVGSTAQGFEPSHGGSQFGGSGQRRQKQVELGGFDIPGRGGHAHQLDRRTGWIAFQGQAYQ